MTLILPLFSFQKKSVEGVIREERIREKGFKEKGLIREGLIRKGGL